MFFSDKYFAGFNTTNVSPVSDVVVWRKEVRREMGGRGCVKGCVRERANTVTQVCHGTVTQSCSAAVLFRPSCSIQQLDLVAESQPNDSTERLSCIHGEAVHNNWQFYKQP